MIFLPLCIYTYTSGLLFPGLWSILIDSPMIGVWMSTKILAASIFASAVLISSSLPGSPIAYYRIPTYFTAASCWVSPPHEPTRITLEQANRLLAVSPTLLGAGTIGERALTVEEFNALPVNERISATPYAEPRTLVETWRNEDRRKSCNAAWRELS